MHFKELLAKGRNWARVLGLPAFFAALVVAVVGPLVVDHVIEGRQSERAARAEFFDASRDFLEASILFISSLEAVEAIESNNNRFIEVPQDRVDRIFESLSRQYSAVEFVEREFGETNETRSMKRSLIEVREIISRLEGSRDATIMAAHFENISYRQNRIAQNIS